jgi:hypothetical protein
MPVWSESIDGPEPHLANPGDVAGKSSSQRLVITGDKHAAMLWGRNELFHQSLDLVCGLQKISKTKEPNLIEIVEDVEICQCHRTAVDISIGILGFVTMSSCNPETDKRKWLTLQESPDMPQV